MRTFRSKVVAALAAAATMAGAALWPAPALAHGPLDYHVIEYHYMRVGPYVYPMAYATRNYYCDGHYQYVPGPGGSLGYAFEQTYDDTSC